MAQVEIYSGEPCFLQVVFPGNPLEAYTRDYADILDVYMGLKQLPSDADDAYVQKFQRDGTGTGGAGGDVIVDAENHTFRMQLSENDTPPPGEYRIYTGVLLTGLTRMVWLRQETDEHNTITVTADGVVR